MHREHAGAQRAASHAGLGNNYSGEVSRALLIDAQTGAEKKHPPAQLSQAPSATKDLPHQPGQVTCHLWSPIFLKDEMD